MSLSSPWSMEPPPPSCRKTDGCCSTSLRHGRCFLPWLPSASTYLSPSGHPLHCLFLRCDTFFLILLLLSFCLSKVFFCWDKMMRIWALRKGVDLARLACTWLQLSLGIGHQGIGILSHPPLYYCCALLLVSLLH